MTRAIRHLRSLRARTVAAAFAAVLVAAVGAAAVAPAAVAAPGDTWVSRTPPINDQYWHGVTYGEGLFVAVAANEVMTSPDGVTWQSRTAPSGIWSAVTYGGGQFVAVANNGGTFLAMTSPDGITWTGQAGLGTPTNWTGVTYGSGKFVAIGEQWVASSADGISWTENATTVVAQWSSVTFGASKFVAVAKAIGGDCTSASGTNCVITSSDGVTWAAASAISGEEWNAVTYGGPSGSELFVSVAGAGSNRVMTSQDGTSWSAAASAAATNYWQSITYGANQFVAVGFGGGVMTSADGSTWTAQTSGNSSLWNAVAAGPQYVAVGQSSGDSIMSSFIYAAPTVSGVSPAVGPVTGGTAVAITGTGFIDGATAAIGGAACTGVAVASATQLTCTTSAAAAGSAAVSVTNPDSQADSLAGAFTYEAAPPSPPSPPSPGKQTQQVAGDCVTASGGFDGSVKKLMKPKCTTNAGQRIGVKVGANRRGDQAYFRLYCKVPGAKATGTRSTGRGDGSRYCTSGSLKVRALAGGLTLRVVWSAPATSDFKAYRKSKSYKV